MAIWPYELISLLLACCGGACTHKAESVPPPSQPMCDYREVWAGGAGLDALLKAKLSSAVLGVVRSSPATHGVMWGAGLVTSCRSLGEGGAPELPQPIAET